MFKRNLRLHAKFCQWRITLQNHHSSTRLIPPVQHQAVIWKTVRTNWIFCEMPYIITKESEVENDVCQHDDVIKWKHFPRYWPFVRGIHRSTVNSPYKGQWREALVFSLICAWMNGCVNNRMAGDLRRHCAHYDVTVMNDGHFVQASIC